MILLALGVVLVILLAFGGGFDDLFGDDLDDLGGDLGNSVA